MTDLPTAPLASNLILDTGLGHLVCLRPTGHIQIFPSIAALGDQEPGFSYCMVSIPHSVTPRLNPMEAGAFKFLNWTILVWPTSEVEVFHSSDPGPLAYLAANGFSLRPIALEDVDDA